jgi:transglycosylase-like protein
MLHLRRLAVAAGLAAAAIFTLPAVASADSAICHNGVLSDDAGQGCADGLYAQVYGGGSGGSSGSGDPAICHNGILSDDAGQGCSDGLYAAAYGSGGPAPAPAAPSSAAASTGGSSNSMVDPSCESGGNSQIVSSNGQYWGKYQFNYATWVAHGGSPGSYGSASEAEQDAVASRVTYDAWPNC